jgi:transcriptional regulator with PAS, ATPase and Fis domain
VPFHIPPLRERCEDIWPLALHHLGLVQRRSNKSGIRFSDASRRLMEEHGWPGNVRELVNVVERAVALAKDGATVEIKTDDLRQVPPPGVESPPSDTTVRRASPTKLRDSMQEYERTLIADALARANGNRTRAAQELGLSRQALAIKISKYKL